MSKPLTVSFVILLSLFAVLLNVRQTFLRLQGFDTRSAVILSLQIALAAALVLLLGVVARRKLFK